MNEEISLRPFALEAELTGYMPIPRQLLEMNLPSNGSSNGFWSCAYQCASTGTARGRRRPRKN